MVNHRFEHNGQNTPLTIEKVSTKLALELATKRYEQGFDPFKKQNQGTNPKQI